ncbi:biotin/lipoyl-binding carrier protein [Saccharopolyspora sp. NPDC050389]|uniref:biotin/lipoyl-binding carrier protein n=1 Tax=Saccharopolyspora sp. NPDC050389 TaxID=3155516 RepID=UPI0033F2B943
METVKADLGANVWKVLVAPGDTVEEDSTLMILESMKMEIPVLAECSGQIESVHVTEGGTVEAGDPLVAISPDGS